MNRKDKKLYKKVLEDFSIDYKDIKLRRFNRDFATAGLAYGEYTTFFGRTKLYVALCTTRLFYGLSDEEKKGVFAHELGHGKRILRFKNHPEKIKKLVKWNRKMEPYLAHYIQPKKKDARLIKWHMMKEMYADNLAAEAGYGPQFLMHLRDVHKRYDYTPVSNTEMEARIENLEKKIRKLNKIKKKKRS